MTHVRAKLLGLLVIALVSVAAVASAQTRVVVQVRTAGGTPGEATVTLTPEGGGASHSCRTSDGTCQLSNVPAGMYVVTARPTAEGEAPSPRTVPVVPAGEVTISVTLR